MQGKFHVLVGGGGGGKKERVIFVEITFWFFGFMKRGTIKLDFWGGGVWLGLV